MSSQDRPIVRGVRRATSADAAAIAAIAPDISPQTGSETRATFVIDGEAAPLAVIDLLQRADHISVEHFVVASADQVHELGRTLIAFAEAAARTIGAGEVRLRPGIVPEDLASALGYRAGAKAIKSGALARARDHLEAVGVPLWRDGTATLDQTLYYRGVWAAIALLIGLGSISLAVFSPGKVTLLHVVVPAILCAVGTVFAVWQIALVAVAARRVGRGFIPFLTAGAALAAVLAIGALLYDRAVPSLAELWNIYSGDEELNDLAVSVSPDGTTLHVAGSYGVSSADGVRLALEQNPRIRTVVLSGPGGRIGAAFQINRMIRNRRLATRVDTGCASACTIAFLGGVDRSISASGRLGFHQGSFPGMDQNDMHESNRDMKRFLVAGAGVTPDFAQRVVDTPADTIWVPTPDELLAGRVITRVNR